MSPQKIAISATFTANSLADTLSFWLQTLDWPASVECAPTAQPVQHLLDPHGLLAQNQAGINIILLRLEDWLPDRPAETMAWPEEGESETAALNSTQTGLGFEQALQTAATRSPTPYLVALCPLSPQTLADPSLEAASRQLVARLTAVVAGLDSVHLITPDDITRWYPLSPQAIFDPVSAQIDQVPFTPEFFAALGSTLARKIYRLTQPPPKVIVLDCDQTLWRGVCAEDSPTELSIEGPWRFLQKFMVAQGQAGRLLCLCSKNHEVDVMRVFAQRLDMPLRGEHLVAWRINWRPKSENLRSLAEELQLGLDSFLLLDDNPLECAEVRANCPDVVTLQLPADPAQIPHFLNQVWAFDVGQTTAEDQQRGRRYRQAYRRRQWATTGPSYADFLAGLELEVRILALQSSHLPRAAQLTQRVNQFNITTARHAETELRHSLENGQLEALMVEVNDRFGDYGLVGLMLFFPQNEALVVDTFLLSCRALGRGVEYQMLSRLGQIAVERQLSHLILPYRTTARNHPAFEFLLTVGHQYRSTEENRVIFKLPAPIAVAVRFDVKIQEKSVRPGHQLAAPESVGSPADPASERYQTAPTGLWQADLLTRIATELATPAQILQIVRHGHEQSRSGTVAPSNRPETDHEVMLAALWADILGLDQVSRLANFFELGGNSLLATQLIARLHRAGRGLLALHQVFETPALWELAKVVAAAETQTAPPPISPLTGPGPAPLSLAQQRLWFMAHRQPGDPVYHLPLAVRWHGRLDRAALTQSVTELTRRHPQLRTTIGAKAGQPCQVIHSFDAWQAQLDLLAAQADEAATADLDLSRLPPGEQQAELERLTMIEVTRPFDIQQGPLWRTRLVKLNAAETEHLWLLTFHHLISDRWSTHKFLAEVSQLYAAFAGGDPAVLPDLPIQYTDYAQWQRQQSWQRELAYWQAQLADLPGLHLFTDYPRPAHPPSAGATHRFEIPESLVEPLQALSRKTGTTLFMTMLTAFATLLYRYSDQTDFAIGVPVANRPRAELEHLIGCLVNTLLLRVNLAGNPTFLTLLERVRHMALGAYAHQEVPFERLVELLPPARDLTHQPLFQVMLSWQNETPLQALHLPQLTAELLPVERGSTICDLSLVITETQGRLSGALEYRSALFAPATIERMAGHFLTLLAGIVADPLQPVSTLPLLTETERQQLLVEWSRPASVSAGQRSIFESLGRSVANVSKRLLHQVTGLPNGHSAAAAEGDPAAICFHHMFEAQAALTPEATAVFSPRDGVKLTYAQLNRWSNQVAHYLRALGVGPEVLVGLCVDRSLNMIVGLLGILKAGGAYLPLDPTYPARRLAFMLTDAQVSVLLTEAHLTGTSAFVEFVERGGKLVRLSKEWPVMSRFKADDPASPTSPVSLDHLAYVIYTSGSTGRPKGVMVEHRALSWFARTAQALYGFGPTERVLQFSSISFDISVEEIFPCLASGGTLVLRPDEMLRSLPHFLESCAAWGITALFLPTAFWHELAAQLTANPALLPPSLRLISFGGEKVRPDQVAAWQETFGGAAVQLMNGYGPTETTVIATLHPLSAPADAPRPAADLIGRVIPGAEVYVLDQHFQPVPIGVPGQLYLGGAGLARGYLNRPDLTSQAFIAHPFRPGERLYKTGDLARYRPDGQLEYLGRLDHQLKIGGYRVELTKIETALGGHPQVRQTVVVPHPVGAGRQLLVAYVVPVSAADQPADLAELARTLRRFLKEKLPSYMLPAGYVWLEALPLDPNGKVDRHALPVPDLIDPPLKTEAETEVGPIPLTPIQRWFFDQALPDPNHWNMAVLVELDTAPNMTLLARAVTALLRHHETLRYQFKPTATGRWEQIKPVTPLNPWQPAPVIDVDLADLPPALQQEMVCTVATQLHELIRLAEGRLLQVALFTAGAHQPAKLLLVAHQLVIDGLSWRILLADLQTAYRQLSQGQAVQLPPKTSSTAAWADQLQQRAQSVALAQELAYWTTAVPARVARLPLEHSAENSEGSTQTVIVSLDPAATHALLAHLGADVHEILLGVLGHTLAAWIETDSLAPPWLIEVEGPGREPLGPEVGVSRTVGWFTSRFPLSLPISRDQAVVEAIDVAKTQLRRVPQGGLGYGLLRYLSDLPGAVALRSQPSAEISFNYLGQFDQLGFTASGDSTAGELRLVTLTDRAWLGVNRHPAGLRSHELNLDAYVLAGQLHLTWTYSSARLSRETVDRLAAAFLHSLAALQPVAVLA